MRRPKSSDCSFNTQPPEGGWAYLAGSPVLVLTVSTHSRLKAAGFVNMVMCAN